jgi:hypothetical protein
MNMPTKIVDDADVVAYARRHVQRAPHWRLRLRRCLWSWAVPAAWWIVRRSGGLAVIDTLEGVELFYPQQATPETKAAVFHAYEGGRHRLLWKLMHPKE